MSFHYHSGNGAYDSSASGHGSHSPGETFLCLWVGADGLHCDALIRGYEVSAHLRGVHGIRGSDKDRVWCLWESCNMALNKESLARHVEETHMRIVYKCECGTKFSRKDTLNKHRRTCSQASQH